MTEAMFILSAGIYASIDFHLEDQMCFGPRLDIETKSMFILSAGIYASIDFHLEDQMCFLPRSEIEPPRSHLTRNLPKHTSRTYHPTVQAIASAACV